MPTAKYGAAIRAALRPTYYSALSLRPLKEGTVVLDSMGKVGTQAIEAAIRQGQPSRAVFSSHCIGEKLAAPLRELDQELPGLDHLQVPISEMLRRRIRRSRGLKVITLTREPIAQVLSSFFQVYEQVYRSYLFSSEPVSPDSAATRCCDYISSQFLERAHGTTPQSPEDKLTRYFFDRAVRFFDEETIPVWGIDPYSLAPLRDDGWRVFKGKCHDFLIIRYESLAACWPEASSALLGSPACTLSENNVTATKGNVGSVYAGVKENIAFDSEELANYYRNRIVCSFYCEESIARSIAKWTRVRS